MGGRTVFFFSLRFWPGFQKLWLKGDFHSLLVSLLFGWVLAITWTATFIWPEWIGNAFSVGWIARLVFYGLWVALAGAALTSAVQPAVGASLSRGLSYSDRQKNLELAQEYYLQANYFEAEKLLRRNLSKGTQDVESSLLWISILRRTRRIPQALEMISEIDRLDAALPWMAELRAEKEQCLRLKIQTPPAHD